MAELQAAAAEAGGQIMIIDRGFIADKTISLIAACDCYVSLHRNEDLGLTMAEAMRLGKPVIATLYSANLDVMHDEISTPIRPYDQARRWASPS